MSEEQKKQVEGVLREMKHMNPQQIEVMIAYMQGVAAAAKLMGERKEQSSLRRNRIHGKGGTQDAEKTGDPNGKLCDEKWAVGSL